MLPQEFYHLFWDIDVRSFDPLAYPEYTIARVLELGDEGALQWLSSVFDEDMIKSVVMKDRRLSPKSANYWAFVYHIPRENIAVFNYK